jgi:hypothetical protein
MERQEKFGNYTLEQLATWRPGRVLGLYMNMTIRREELGKRDKQMLQKAKDFLMSQTVEEIYRLMAILPNAQLRETYRKEIIRKEVSQDPKLNDVSFVIPFKMNLAPVDNVKDKFVVPVRTDFNLRVPYFVDSSMADPYKLTRTGVFGINLESRRWYHLEELVAEATKQYLKANGLLNNGFHVITETTASVYRRNKVGLDGRNLNAFKTEGRIYELVQSVKA